MTQGLISKVDYATWDGFVDSQTEARYCYLTGYGIALEEVYHLKPYYYAIWEDNCIKAVLPAFVVGLPWARHCVSIPFSQFGGPLFDHSAENIEELYDHLTLGLLRTVGADSIEMRGLNALAPSKNTSRAATNEQFEYAILDLEASEDQLFREKFDHSVRKAVHKAEREGIYALEDSSEACLVREFYPRYLRAMKRLGTPPHPIDYFIALRRHLGDRLRVYWAVHGDRFVSGLMGVSTAKRVNILYIVSDEKYHELRPNDLVHWRFIQWACSSGHKWFDFGVARYQGQYRFKRKWGTDFHPYRITNFNLSGRTVKAHVELHHKVLSWIWARFVPLRLTPIVGRYLRRLYTQ